MAGRILIVDDVATNRIVLKVKLAEAGYDTRLAASAAEAQDHLRAGCIDLMILARALRDLDGLILLQRLRADGATRDIPVIVTLSEASAGARHCALRAGADDVMVKPLSDVRLMARLRALLRTRDGTEDLRAGGAVLGAIGLAETTLPFERPALVALVTERPETAVRLRAALGEPLARSTILLSRIEALSEDGPSPDAFVIEAGIGGAAGGLRLMSELRSRGEGRHAAICILMPGSQGDEAAMAFDLGANDVIGPETDPQELGLRLAALLRRKRSQDRLRDSVSDGLRLALIDPLTGLHNRRYGLAHLNRLVAQARKAASPLAVMVVDLDRFKSVNDAFGHAAGDCVLTEVARRLKDNLRDGDMLARIGGEEFLVGLPDISLARAKDTAVRLCRAIEEQPIAIDAKRTVIVTASIGLAEFDATAISSGDDVPGLVARADHALLASKQQGRNRVSISRSAA